MFNDKKIELLRYGNIQEVRDHFYTNPTGELIQEKNSLRDLGVLLSNNLKFNEHIDNVCSIARKYCGWVLRTFKSRDPYLMKTMWGSMILPRIDYCSQLWAPTTKGELQKIESLQRSFTSYIPSLRHLNYWERLDALKLYSLERRFERYRIIYIWKILEHKVPNYGIISYESARLGRLCKIPKIMTSAKYKTISLRESSLSVRGAQLFNSIPQHIRNMTNCKVTKFKLDLDNYLKNIPDHPRVKGYTQICHTESNSIIHMAKLHRDSTPHVPVCSQGGVDDSA